jgi:uncharacterized protein
MLLIPTFRAPSAIHGLGLFAATAVPQGTRVWEFTEGFDQAIDPARLSRLPDVAREQFLQYSYLDRVIHEYILCSDDARFMNHSEEPTLHDTSDGPGDRYGHTVAAHDLAAGEELTCDYREFDVSDHHPLDSTLHTRASDPRPSQTSYVAPQLTVRELSHKGGCGLIAREPIVRGEVLVVWGGEAVTWDELMTFSDRDRRFSVQVEEQVFLAPVRRNLEPGDFINHSCSPNAGMSGQIAIVAMRDISPGEEVCFDYAMTDSVPYDEFPCGCGAVNCRGRVTANDWKLPELQKAYKGYFSPYLQRLINRKQVRPRRRRRPLQAGEPVVA